MLFLLSLHLAFTSASSSHSETTENRLASLDFRGERFGPIAHQMKNFLSAGFGSEASSWSHSIKFIRVNNQDRPDFEVDQVLEDPVFDESALDELVS